MLSLLITQVLALPVETPPVEYYEFSHEQKVHGEQLGGLSGLSYQSGDCYAAVSDARNNPLIHRFCFGDNELTWQTPIVLSHASGESMSDLSLDGEGLERAPDGWWLSAELTTENPDQFLFHINPQGSATDSFRLPPELSHYQFVANGTFEGLTALPDGTLLTALEKPPLNQSADQRLLTPLFSIHTDSGEVALRGYYPLDEVMPNVDRGLVALSVLPFFPEVEPGLTLDQDETEVLEAKSSPRYLLAVERHYEPGVGNRIVFFVFDLPNESDELAVVSKHRWFELAELGIDCDNIEGVVFDSYGRLVLVSDNNFSSHQRTQIIRLDFRALFQR
ncbi:esterase-like activity of phytase family protein [Umboniibacter marinipuniceus]|uniref:Phytase-like domain-containing protein n=1 Tax=Umboniibacter marinipuniceus TaxID=569599 RepID=A0A3M0AA70_9GAMM|nr:esterase-like activity of phytase family protein [Umboniibacter marinipuniceus]RMA79285.1 hypothetical protein DFR27_1725 [Umboniibacter marinipuniceus]